MIGDNHTKAYIKCSKIPNHKGRPRASGEAKPYGYKWFMIMNPENPNILAMMRMGEVEDNQMAINTLERILRKYPFFPRFHLKSLLRDLSKL